MLFNVRRRLVIIALKHFCFDLNRPFRLFSYRKVKLIFLICFLHIFYFLRSKWIIVLILVCVPIRSVLPHLTISILLWLPWIRGRVALNDAALVRVALITSVLLVIKHFSHLGNSIVSCLTSGLSSRAKSVHSRFSMTAFRNLLFREHGLPRGTVKVVHCRCQPILVDLISRNVLGLVGLVVLIECLFLAIVSCQRLLSNFLSRFPLHILARTIHIVCLRSKLFGLVEWSACGSQSLLMSKYIRLVHLWTLINMHGN